MSRSPASQLVTRGKENEKETVTLFGRQRWNSAHWSRAPEAGVSAAPRTPLIAGPELVRARPLTLVNGATCFQSVVAHSPEAQNSKILQAEATDTPRWVAAVGLRVRGKPPGMQAGSHSAGQGKQVWGWDTWTAQMWTEISFSL